MKEKKKLGDVIKCLNKELEQYFKDQDPTVRKQIDNHYIHRESVRESAIEFILALTPEENHKEIQRQINIIIENV